jgi:SAM-dependent methyltransferase
VTGPDPGRSLDVAARAFWWRPALAVQQGLMLEAYARAGLALEPPLADLGCGTGLFGAALVERGVADGIDVGLDWQLDDLRRAARRPRLGLLRGDLRALPLADGSLGSAVSHCVLSSFVGDGPAGLGRALAEVRRVLRPGGLFVCCVATPAYAANATSVRLARRLGRGGLARRVEAWIDRRNDHTVLLDREGWEDLLRGAGLRVEACRPVLARGYAGMHRWLALLRGADLPRRLGLAAAAPAQAAAQARLLRRALGGAFAAEAERMSGADAERAGFLLLVARKAASVA